MTGDNHHVRTCRPNLVHLSATVVHPLIIITGRHGTAAAAATDLMHPVGIQVNPIFQAVIENPTWFLKKAMSELHLGLAPVVTRIVIGGQAGKAVSIDFNSLLLNVANQQVEYRHEFKLVKGLRVVFFKPRPG